MSPMSPAMEREDAKRIAEELIDACVARYGAIAFRDFDCDLVPDLKLSVATALRTAEAAGMRRARQECCEAVCQSCREGRELVEHRAVSGRVIGWTHKWATEYGSEMTSGCTATDIRAAAILAQSPGENNNG